VRAFACRYEAHHTSGCARASRLEPWKWAMLAIGIALLWASRDRDDVLKHRVV
jgi:hypothetical protein